MPPQNTTEQPCALLVQTKQQNKGQQSAQDTILRQQQQYPDVTIVITASPFSSAAAPLQPPSPPVDCTSCGAESDLQLSPDNTTLSSSHTAKAAKQVSFPTDDAIAVVHHLRPSSSAGDLSTRHDDGSTAAGDVRGSSSLRFLARCVQILSSVQRQRPFKIFLCTSRDAEVSMQTVQLFL